MAFSYSNAAAAYRKALYASILCDDPPTAADISAMEELANCVQDYKDIFKEFTDIFVPLGAAVYFVILPTCFYFLWRSHRKDMERLDKEFEILTKRDDEDDKLIELLLKKKTSRSAATPPPSGVIDEQTSHFAATPPSPTGVIDEAELEKLLTPLTSHSAAPPSPPKVGWRRWF